MRRESGNSVSKNSNNESEIDLLSISRELWDHKWFLLITMSICFILCFLYSLKQSPQYRANLLIQIEENQSRTKAIITNNSRSPLLETTRRDPSAVQSALIKSRFILEPVVEELNLDLELIPHQMFWQKIFKRNRNKPTIDTFEVPYQAIGKTFHLVYEGNNQIKLYNKKKKCVLEGKVGELLLNPDRTIKLKVNTMFDIPKGSQFDLLKKSSTQVINELNRKLKIEDIGVKRNIGILEISIQDTSGLRAVEILNHIAKLTKEKDGKKKALEASKLLAFLEKQLPFSKNALETAELAFNQYRASSGKIDVKLQAQKILQQIAELDKQIATLELNKIDMYHRYTERHPAWITLTQQIDQFKKERHKLKLTLKQLPERDQTAVNLMREIEVKSNLYTTLLNKIQELQVIKASTLSDVRILSFAKVPDASLPSKRNLMYIASLLMGFLLGSLFIFCRKLFFPRIEDPHWIERNFNIPNLAIIPFAQEQNSQIKDNNLNIKINQKATEKPAFKDSTPLLAQTNARHLAIESLRNLRMNLYVNLSCARNNIISILGVSSGIGKTFLASNLAYLLANANKRVLLIDADLRAGSIHQQFNLSNRQGFSELIQGKISVNEAIQASPLKQLSILTCGQHPQNPSELLLSEQCKKTIKHLAEQFDIVILDTASVLPMTDATAIGSLSATNYLVVGAKAHSPLDIEMVIKHLFSAGVSIQGSIFNFYNTESKKTPYYKYYSYQNSYNEGLSEKIFHY